MILLIERTMASISIMCLSLILVLINLTVTEAFPKSGGTVDTILSQNDDYTQQTYSNTDQYQKRLIDAKTIDSYYMAYINYSYINEYDEEIVYSEEKGKYGEGLVMDVEGILVHVTSMYNRFDHSACQPDILGTNGANIPNEPWIALIKRGGCNFEDKVRNAWIHKAAGVIIYNDRESSVLDKMRIDDKERNITAVFTYKWLGEKMANLVDRNFELSVSIIQGTKCLKPYNNLNRTSVLFVSVSFIVLMVISLIWLIFYYVQRFRHSQTKDKKSKRLCNLAKRIISKIPTKTLKADDKECENDCCPICIEPYRVSDLIRLLPCKHEFHKTCIDPWLLEHRTCPMCKMDILKHYGFAVGDKKLSSSRNSSSPSQIRTVDNQNAIQNNDNQANANSSNAIIGTNTTSHDGISLSVPGRTESSQITDV